MSDRSALRHRRQRLTCQPLRHKACQEIRERNDILTGARLLQGLHVTLAVAYGCDSPGISAGRHH